MKELKRTGILIKIDLEENLVKHFLSFRKMLK